MLDTSLSTASAQAGDALEQRIQAAFAAMRAGRPVLVLDDDDRENEGDLIIAAETLSDPVMAMMIRDGSGIVCLCLTEQDTQRLDLGTSGNRLSKTI